MDGNATPDPERVAQQATAMDEVTSRVAAMLAGAQRERARRQATGEDFM
ncbi:MAG TPA: hypothetical protein VGL46_21490 [Pseudonocardiaceae bacterium]